MATIRKRALPSGKQVWQADYRDGAGKRKHKQFATKKLADEFLLTARGEVRAGVHVAASDSITVDRAAKLWLAHVEKLGRERSTVDRYAETYSGLIKPKFGASKLTALTAPAIQTYIDELVGTMSISSLKKVKGAFVSIYKFASARGYAASNPARDVTLPDGRRGRQRPEMPSKDELRRILQSTPPRWQPFIRLATVTGMRASELRGLQWKDVDTTSGMIKVRRRVDKYNEFGPPKSEAGTRDIPISAATVSMLTAWQKDCPASDLDLVFPTSTGAVEGHANLLHRVFHPAQLAASVAVNSDKVDNDGKPIMVAKYGLHALRHAAAALFIEQGFPPKKVQSLMGHASLAMTYDVYGYLFPSEDDDRAKVEAMEAGLFV